MVTTSGSASVSGAGALVQGVKHHAEIGISQMPVRVAIVGVEDPAGVVLRRPPVIN